MPSQDGTTRRLLRGKYMLVLVKEAIRGLRDPYGSTVNDISKYLQSLYDDDVMRDTSNLISLIWRALSIGINTKQIIVSSDGHRYKLGQDIDSEVETLGDRDDVEEENGNDAHQKTVCRVCKRRKKKKSKEGKRGKRKGNEGRRDKKREKKERKGKKDKIAKISKKKDKAEKVVKKLKEFRPRGDAKRNGRKGDKPAKGLDGRRSN